MSIPDREMLKWTFDLLVGHAVKGERCPTKDQLGTAANKAISVLAHAGRIRVEVSAHNWRVVEIREGEHMGKRTAPNPIPGAKPYMVVGSRRDVLPEAVRMIDVCIDVSDNNIITSWPLVAGAGIKVAFVKAMDGNGPIYSTWNAQSAGVRSVGIFVIPYAFLSASSTDEVAAALIGETGLVKGSPVALDWEGRANQTCAAEMVETIGAALSVITERSPLGYWGMAGSTPAQPTARLQRWDRWIPRYPQLPQPPNFAAMKPSSVAKCPQGASFWQYTSAGVVPGIAGNVDRSVWTGTLDELSRWCANE